MLSRYFLVLFAAALAFPSLASGKAVNFTVFSMGTKSCGNVVTDFKENDVGKLTNSIWVAGYITAINERVYKGSNVAAGTNPAAWDLWINNYCSANPLETLSSATTALVVELSKRRQ